MLFRDLKLKEDVVLDATPVHVLMPVHVSLDDAKAAFSDPLSRQLAAAGLGEVTEARARLTNSGASDGLDLFLGLTTVDPSALQDVILMLEHLGAPKGSQLRLVDGGNDIEFGRAVGMEISVSTKGGVHEARFERLSRACIEAVGKVAILQGTRKMPDRIALYFYGVNPDDMQRGLAEKLSAHPVLCGANLRPLH